MTYVARFTNLHPRLWHRYGITAYPHGFHNWPGELALPVWEPFARVITSRGACIQPLGDCHTLEDAIEACWAHNVDAAEHDSVDAYYAECVEGWTEYAYLYRQGVWFVTKVGGGAGAFLCSADDPDGQAPAKWENLEGVLNFRPPAKPSYALDPRQVPQLPPVTVIVGATLVTP